MNGNFEIGLFLPVGGEGMMGGRTADYQSLREMTVCAEQAGYDFVGVLDHLLFHHWECWTILGALADATSTIRLMSYVTCTGYRNPALLARMVDTMDEISDGRFILGVGAGDSDTEHRTFGFPNNQLVSRFEDAMQIIVPLVKTGRLDRHDGEFYSAHDITFQPRGPSEAGVPILVGSLGGPRMMDLTVRFADIWTASLPATNSSLSGFETMLKRFNEACYARNRDPSDFEKMVELVVRAPGGPETEWWDGETIAGDSQQIGEQLRAFRDLGANKIMLWVEPNTADGIQTVADAVAIAKRD